jgi:hypothetical protein
VDVVLVVGAVDLLERVAEVPCVLGAFPGGAMLGEVVGVFAQREDARVVGVAAGQLPLQLPRHLDARRRGVSAGEVEPGRGRRRHE